MRFLNKKRIDKTFLVLSDLHLGAGQILKGKRNLLEDFHFDEELIDFLKYYSTGDYESREVELIINGDFLDFLAVPFVEYFDDEFWSEEAALSKLKIILSAHFDVIKALKEFVHAKNKKIVYMIGNHDAEMIFPSLKNHLIDVLGNPTLDQFFMSNELELYIPAPGIFIKHGHQYERAHQFSPADSLVKDQQSGRVFFIPPWGSYYVMNVINKYKQERSFINAVRPVKHFIIHGFIFDTFFTIRFLLSNLYYFFMVRFWYYLKMKLDWKKILTDLQNELALFQDYENITRDFFVKNPKAKVLIVGHTHHPTFRLYEDGTTFINTGTWTRMINLDLGVIRNENALTYASIHLKQKEYELSEFDQNVEVDLKRWRGVNLLPFEEFR